MSTPLATSDFVELNRQFILVPDRPTNDSAADESYSQYYSWRYERTFSWEEILKHPRVIVLGEAGSGKTTEFQHQVNKLTVLKKFAFFVRIDEIVHDSLERALGPTEWERFNTWRHSFEDATFFLDSVDESKLGRPADFYIALRRFRDAMPPDFVPRTSILLSARISDWHPESDGREVRKCFGLPLLADYSLSDNSVDLVTVHLAPLEWTEVSTFLEAKGLNDPWGFHNALSMALALDFIRRPLDALALFEFWQRERRLGSLTELIESDLAVKLQERPSRAHDPLSPTDSRAGAEALAAAAVFCKRASFKVRDDSMIAGALDGRACVPSTWTDDQYDALLRRAVFDCASRGCIRFHHRRTREYLAASWVAARMQNGCPIHQLEQLFFERIGRARVIRRSLAPIAAWLAAGDEQWNDNMRRWILEAAPGIHLQFGDPGTLAPEYKRRVLHALVSSDADNNTVSFMSETDVLRRFVDPSMEVEIAAMIEDESLPHHLRAAMLKIAKLGSFSTCATIAIKLVSSVKESLNIRVAAANLIADCKEAGPLEQLREVALALPELPEELTSIFIAAFARRHMDPSVGWILLSNTKLTTAPIYRTHTGVSLSFSYLPKDWTYSLLHQVLRYLRESSPDGSSEQRDEVSDPRALKLLILPKLLLAVLEHQHSDNVEGQDLPEDVVQDVVAAFGMADWIQQTDGHEWQRIGKATEGQCALRQRLFWDFVDRRYVEQGLKGVARGVRRMLPADPHRDAAMQDILSSVKEFMVLFGQPDEFAPPFELMLTDLKWLKAGRGNSGPLDELVKRSIEIEMKRQAQATASAERARKIRLQRAKMREIRHEHRRFSIRELSAANSFRQLLQSISGLLDSIKGYFLFYWHLCRVFLIGHRNEETPFARELSQLGFIGHRASQRAAKVLFEQISSDLKPVRHAIKSHWRRFVPPRPDAPNTDSCPAIELMIANACIEAIFEEGTIDPRSFTTEDVCLLTQCAVAVPCWEFPSWFPLLAGHRPDDVDEALANCIELRWQWDTERPDILEKVKHFTAGPKVRHLILEKLTPPTLPRADSSQEVIDILLSFDDPPMVALHELAQRYVVTSTGDISFRAIWLALWLKADPDGAMDFWENRLLNVANAEELLTFTCSNLLDEVRRKSEQRWWSASQIRRMILLTSRDIHKSKNRATNSPILGSDEGYKELRQKNALEFCDQLWRVLAEDPTPEATMALDDFISDTQFRQDKDYVTRLRREQVSRRVDAAPWRPEDIHSFDSMYCVERLPRIVGDSVWEQLSRALIYRTKPTAKEIKEFVDQFPKELRPGVVRMLFSVKCYDGAEFQNIFKDFASRNGPLLSDAVFASFTECSGSDANIKYIVEKTLGVKVHPTLERALAEGGEQKRIILLDDCVLSGKQAGKIFLEYLGHSAEPSDVKPLSPEQNHQFSRAEVVLLTALLTVDGASAVLNTPADGKRLRDHLPKLRVEGAAALEWVKLFAPHNTLFDGTILAEAEKFFRDVGYSILEQRSRGWFNDSDASESEREARRRRNAVGYGDDQALLVFGYNVPKATVTLLWESRGQYLNSPWKPLFPVNEPEIKG